MKHTFFSAIGVIVLVGACSGGSSSSGGTGGAGGSGGGDDLVVPSFASVSAVTDEGNAALARIGSLGATSVADIPSSGTATYEGTIVVNDVATASSNASVVGGFALSVDFADANNVVGTAGNFLDTADTAVGGTLELDNVTLGQGTVGGGLEGDLDGRLTNVGETGVDDDFDYDLDIASIYFGSDVDAMTIVVGGTATNVDTNEDVAVSGASTVERQ